MRLIFQSGPAWWTGAVSATARPGRVIRFCTTGPAPEKAKAFKLRKTANEGIQRIPPRTREANWSHPSLMAEKWLDLSPTRRAQPDRYPDFGLFLAPAFPLLHRAVAVGVRIPSQWRYRPRVARGSLSSGCQSRRATGGAVKEQKTSIRADGALTNKICGWGWTKGQGRILVNGSRLHPDQAPQESNRGPTDRSPAVRLATARDTAWATVQ